MSQPIPHLRWKWRLRDRLRDSRWLQCSQTICRNVPLVIKWSEKDIYSKHLTSSGTRTVSSVPVAIVGSEKSAQRSSLKPISFCANVITWGINPFKRIITAVDITVLWTDSHIILISLELMCFLFCSQIKVIWNDWSVLCV